MVRKLSLAIALALGITPLAVNSLGLGNIQTKSGLNQQFQADIELLSLRGEELADIRVSLASEEAFAKAGVSRPYFLSNLKFKPILLPSGKGVVRVTSSEPVREPFLNFLIELNWPKGRLYREYTVLLDPPVTLQRRPSPIRSATVSKKVETTGKGVPTKAAQTVVSDGQKSGEYGPTQRNDTLWKIATKVRYSGTSMEQMMMAIFKANPQAFIKNNINNLKIGEILRVPERESVLSMTANEARIAFKDQLENWRADDVPDEVQPMAAKPAEVQQGDSQIAEEKPTEEQVEPALPEAELKIASTDTAEDTVKSAVDSVDQVGEGTGLNEDLIEAREQRESALEESRELKNRVEKLSSELEDLERLLQLKDAQLARLQVALGENVDLTGMPVAEESIAMEKADQPVEMESAKVESTDQPTSVEESTTAKLAAADEEKIEIEIDATEGVIQSDTAATEVEKQASMDASEPEKAEITTSSATSAVDTQSTLKSEPVVAASETKVEAQPSPTVETKPEQKTEKSFLDYLISHPLLEKVSGNPLMLVIGGGVVIILLGLIWLFSRRRKESQEFQESILMDTKPDSKAPEAITQTELVGSESDGSEETSFLSDFSPSEIGDLSTETGETDPIAEAEVYISYGRFGQAETLIRQGLERDPGNNELKLKLFEILSATKNVAAFTELAEKTKTEGLPEVDPGVWNSVLTMGAKLAPDNKLFKSQADGKTENAENDLASLDDLDFGDLTDSLDMDFDPKQDQTKAEPQLSPGQDKQPVVKSEASEAENVGVLEMDDLADELAAIEAATGLEGAKSDQLDMHKLAEQTVSQVGFDNIDLDSSSLDLNSENKDEIERLELPVMDESVGEASKATAADDSGSSDEIDTKLDLARAYLDVGDQEGARSILQEVVSEGSERHKQAARELISSFS